MGKKFDIVREEVEKQEIDEVWVDDPERWLDVLTYPEIIFIRRNGDKKLQDFSERVWYDEDTGTLRGPIVVPKLEAVGGPRDLKCIYKDGEWKECQKDSN